MESSGREVGGGRPTFCVTGATGYIGSWLVKCLLQKGYIVHATARNPGQWFITLFSATIEKTNPFMVIAVTAVISLK